MEISKEQEMNKLIETLNNARHAYYNLNNPVMTDKQYDELFDRLSAIEKELGIALSNSPTQSVGYEVVSAMTKVNHTIPLLSLDKTKDSKALADFIGDEKAVLMLKADGLTIRLEYEDGKLFRASTRGNGTIGEDITHNAKKFKNIPLTIPYTNSLSVEGEAIIHINDFDKMNATLSEDEKYATPRNLVAGSVRQLDSAICAERNVHFYAFGISTRNDDIPDSKLLQFKMLGSYGFVTIIHADYDTSMVIENCSYDLPDYTITALEGNPSSIDLLIHHLKTIAEHDFIPIDGMVLAFDSCSYGDSLGTTSHHGKNAIAFKFADEAVETTLRSIEWSMGRTGTITPVAIFDAVIIDGTEVTRASVHNLSILRDLELGIGDKITVYKANMIIPQIEDNLTRSNTIHIPMSCPFCGGDTFVDHGNNSMSLVCVGNNCSAKLVKKLAHFVSRNAMNIDGLSEATLQKFVDEGYIKEFIDIYALSQYQNNIEKMEGFGKRSTQKLLDAIEKSKTVKMENFLYALGVNTVGMGTAKRLAKYFKNDINAFLYVVYDQNNNMKAINELSAIEDIGDVSATEIVMYFMNDTNHDQVMFLLITGIQIEKPIEKTVNLNNPFAGKSMIATGSLANYTRDSIKEKLESLGVKIVSGVSKKTDYVLAGNEPGQSKIDKANELGIKIISEEEFERMLGGN